MSIDPDDYRLDDETLEEIFLRRIVDIELVSFREPEPAAIPEVVFLAAQEGADTTGFHPAFDQGFLDRGELLVVNQERFRVHHPSVAELHARGIYPGSDAFTAATQQAAQGWYDRSIAWMAGHRYNFAVHHAVRDMHGTMGAAEALAEKGYKVRVAALAVPAPLSRLAIIERHVFNRDYEISDTLATTVARDHDLDYRGVEGLLERAERSPAVAQIQVHTRDGLVHDRQRRPDGRWEGNQGPPLTGRSVEVLNAARNPSFGELQRRAYANRLAEAIDRLHKHGPLPDALHEMAVNVQVDIRPGQTALADTVQELLDTGAGLGDHPDVEIDDPAADVDPGPEPPDVGPDL